MQKLIVMMIIIIMLAPPPLTSDITGTRSIRVTGMNYEDILSPALFRQVKETAATWPIFIAKDYAG